MHIDEEVLLKRIATALEQLASAQQRIADGLDNVSGHAVGGEGFVRVVVGQTMEGDPPPPPPGPEVHRR
jgi:hypothetical protein